MIGMAHKNNKAVLTEALDGISFRSEDVDCVSVNAVKALPAYRADVPAPRFDISTAPRLHTYDDLKANAINSTVLTAGDLVVLWRTEETVIVGPSYDPASPRHKENITFTWVVTPIGCFEVGLWNQLVSEYIDRRGEETRLEFLNVVSELVHNAAEWADTWGRLSEDYIPGTGRDETAVKVILDRNPNVANWKTNPPAIIIDAAHEIMLSRILAPQK